MSPPQPLRLPAVKLYQTRGRQTDGWSDPYGAVHVAADYAGLALSEHYLMRACWQHGCIPPWHEVAPEALTCAKPPSLDSRIFVARQEQVEFLRHHGYTRARAIGLPILYTPPTHLPRQPRSLLVVPTHTLPGEKFEDRRPFEEYADLIQSVAGHFERVVVCIHPSCEANGLWINEFRARKIEMVSGARALDRNALLRMRALFEQFESVTTNGFGSHIAYALTFGAKVSIFGPEVGLSEEAENERAKLDLTWIINRSAGEVLRSRESRRRRREYLDRLYREPHDGLYDPEWGGWLIGVPHKLSPEEMRATLPQIVDTGFESGKKHPRPQTTAEVQQQFQQEIHYAENLMKSGRLAQAAASMERALRLAPNADCVARAQEILAMLRAPAATPAAPADSARPEDFFSPEELQNIEQLIAAYIKDPTGAGTRNQVEAIQEGVMNFLVAAELPKLEPLFRGNFGTVFRSLVKCGITSEPPTEKSSAQLEVLDEALAGADGNTAVFDLRPLLARMLCGPAHRGGTKISPEKIPAWLIDDYLGYVLHAPNVFVVAGEADRYHTHLLGWAQAIHRLTQTAPDEKLTMTVALHFATHANYIPLYFTAHNTREVAEKRAAIMEFVLRKRGAALDVALPPRPAHRRKIKVGYINAHFGAQTETHVTLPALQLDRARFEICLFPVAPNPGPVEDYCRSFADSFTPLPKSVGEQVKTIRDAQLDVAIIGTNITAVTNAVSLLALHRLAPLQLASYCSPVSTGMRHVDGYLTGTLNDGPGLSGHFTEKLFFCEGPPGCLDYTVEAAASTRPLDRAALGIADDETVFINAAACFKILPEMQDTWAKILHAVPKSRLVLLPFNPNWSNAFPMEQFKRSLGEACDRHGVAHDRFILVGSLPSRADVKALERVADVYLDTFPFSGSISVVDPLELGIPPVVQEGATHRSRMASALLREMGLTELIVSDEAAYIDLAVKLGTDATGRQQLRSRILQAVERRPLFLDPAAYARQLGDLLERHVLGDQAPGRATRSTAPELASTP